MKDDIIDYLVDNKHYYQGYCSHILQDLEYLLKHTDKEFHEDIEKQFHSCIIRIVSVDISMKFGCSYTDVIEVLESINWKEYLS